MFIVIEGVDAAGKATQSKAIQEKFVRLGRTAHLYSFPRYDTSVGRIILDLLKGELSLGHAHTIDSSDVDIDGMTTFQERPVAEAMALQALMTVDKYDVASEILQYTRQGHDVVCDRWTPSAECYGAADGLSPEWIRQIQSALPLADFYFYVNVPEEEALRRRPTLRDRYELDRAKQVTVRDNYAKLWAVRQREHEPTLRHWVIVDGIGTPAEVTERIWGRIVLERGIS